MAKVVLHNALGEKIIRAAGLDPSQCTSVVFESRAGEIEKATVEFYTESGGIQVGEFVSTGRPSTRRLMRTKVFGCRMLRW